MPSEFLTIGHSNLPYAEFLARLEANGVTAVADVRSSPRSRLPHFDGKALGRNLPRNGISYVWMGEQLGGRPGRDDLYVDGVADYEAMAREPAFVEGIDRLRRGSARHRIAVMCSEGDPTECHRCLLVGRALSERGEDVRHVERDGRLRTHAEMEESLLSRRKAPSLLQEGDPLVEAYRSRSRKVAFKRR